MLSLLRLQPLLSLLWLGAGSWCLGGVDSPFLAELWLQLFQRGGQPIYSA